MKTCKSIHVSVLTPVNGGQKINADRIKGVDQFCLDLDQFEAGDLLIGQNYGVYTNPFDKKIIGKINLLEIRVGDDGEKFKQYIYSKQKIFSQWGKCNVVADYMINADIEWC